jgi:polyphosphate kinase
VLSRDRHARGGGLARLLLRFSRMARNASSVPANGDPPNRAHELHLNDPSLYFNRELSWLKFNERVLEEALDERNPLLERVNFLSIFFTNLDEFFMIRVSGLRRQLSVKVVELPPDRRTPAEQLTVIREELLPLLTRSIDCWRLDLVPRLREEGIKILSYQELKGRQRKLLRRHFQEEIFPVLTPLAFDPSHPFPHISNLSMNLAVVVTDPVEGEKFARLKVPQTLPRLLRIPDEEKAGSYARLGLAEVKAPYFIWLEEVVAANLDLLFPGLKVEAAYPFRLTRDADLEIEEDEASDLLKAMSDVVGQRHFGSAVRLEIDEAMPPRIRELLTKNLGIAPFQVFTTPKPIGLADVSQLLKVERPDLRYPPFAPAVAAPLATEDQLLPTLARRGSVLLYHPYDSFSTVISALQQAAEDPNVLAIKQTLYRVGRNSPVVEALMEARENGKQVSVLVELKARFDEENNIVWARALERAGVHVVYGVLGLKTHSKICLIVRRGEAGIERLVHLSTGNYNPATARVYTDLGLFTTDPVIADDVSDLFNALTGYSRKREYRKLLVAPWQMRQGMIARIEREIDRQREHGDGYLAFKMNALVDRACIRALYRASQAGVRVDLQVRGICCLRPGVPGISENIRVTSIVGRFLEHSRMYYFRNGGDEELLVGSADLMPRNLGGRVEVLFPIEDPRLRTAVRDDILFRHLRDTGKARLLHPDGSHERVQPAEGEAPVDTQQHFLHHPGSWRLEE